MFGKNTYVQTPEMRAAKENREHEKHDIFSGVFSNTFGLLLLMLLTYSTLTIAYTRNEITAIPDNNNYLYTTPPVDLNNGIIGDEDVTINEIVTQKNGSSVQEQITDSAVVDNTTGDQAAATIVGNNIEAIVPYFVNSVNMVKSNSAGVINTWKNATNYNNIVDVNGNSLLQKAAQSLMNSFLKEETPNASYNTREDINAYFPPAGQTGCGLNAADVDAAECVDNGNTYKITLKLKPDTNPQYGHGSGAVANIITDNQITDPVPSFIRISNVVCAYQGSLVQADIDKSTGHILDYYTKLPIIMSFTALSMNGSIGLQFEEKWEIAW